MLLLLEEDTQNAFWQGQLEEGIVLAHRDAKNAWYRNEECTSACIKLLMYMFVCTHPELFFIKRWWYTCLGWCHAQALYKKREELNVTQLDVLARFFIAKCAGKFGKMMLVSHLEEVLFVNLVPLVKRSTLGAKHKALVYITIAEGAELFEHRQMAKTYVSSAINFISRVDRAYSQNAARCVIEVFSRSALVKKNLG